MSTSSPSTIKILFEQIEHSTHHILTDCDLQSVIIRRGEDQEDEVEKKEKVAKVWYRDQNVGTNVETKEKCVGPSGLKVNVATKYEFQKLNATQIHRAINDPKLGEFLVRVYPLLKEELDNSDLFNKL